mgnify:CR=1 FL=1
MYVDLAPGCLTLDLGERCIDEWTYPALGVHRCKSISDAGQIREGIFLRWPRQKMNKRLSVLKFLDK